MASKQPARRWTVVACLVVIVAQGVVLATITLRGDAREPHRVPLLIAAPAVAAMSLSHEADAMSGTPFDATWTDVEDEARSEVLDGTVVAAVLVDLRRTQDVVLVNARADGKLNDAVADRIAAISASHDRTLTVQEVAQAGAARAAGRVRWFVGLSALLGFGSVLGISLARGLVAGAARLGLLRALGLGVVAIAGALLLQLVPWTRLPATTSPSSGWARSTSSRWARSFSRSRRWPGSSGWRSRRRPTWSSPLPCCPAPPLPAARALADRGALDADRRCPGDARGRGLLRPRGRPPAGARGRRRRAGRRGKAGVARRLRGLSQGSGTQEAMPVRHWRLWVIGAVLPLAVLAGLVVALVPRDVVATPPLPSVATQTTCVDRGGRAGRDRAERPDRPPQ